MRAQRDSIRNTYYFFRGMRFCEAQMFEYCNRIEYRIAHQVTATRSLMTASSVVFGQRPEFEGGGESGHGRPQAARKPAKGGSHRTPGGV